LWLRLLAARWYRLRSFWHKFKQSNDIMDVNPITVKQIMTQYNCSQLIHGHTHREGKHEFMLNGAKATRFVLADWSHRGGSVLSFGELGE
jgi:UDP-2,3-diacylglucosamine hydrolase